MQNLNLLFAFVILFSSPAFAGRGSNPAKPAPPKYKCGIDDELQAKVLGNLHFEMFVHLQEADQYLRSMINCFQPEPLIRGGQVEAMYTDVLSCEDKRDQVIANLPKNFSMMRVNLSLATPQIARDDIVEANLSVPDSYRYNSQPQHPFMGLVPMPDLTPDEVKSAKNYWDRDTDAFMLSYSDRSRYGELKDKLRNADQATLARLSNQEEQAQYHYMTARRTSMRSKYLEAYYKNINAEPLLGFVPETPKGTVEDSKMIVNGLYSLLFNNCVVREMSYSSESEKSAFDTKQTRAAPSEHNWRFQAEGVCSKYISRLKTMVAKGKSLEAQDYLALQLSSKLNWRKQIEEGEEASLEVFSLNKEFVKNHRKLHESDDAYTCQFDRLKSKHEILETANMVTSFAGYIALGAACTFILTRIPYAGAAMAELGAPLCMFGTGLPLNTAFWFVGHGEYIQRFNEVFSSAPGQQTLQDIQALESAQTAMALNTVFLGIGTGVPELVKALRPFAKNMDKWVKFSFARNG